VAKRRHTKSALTRFRRGAADNKEQKVAALQQQGKRVAMVATA
jgi:hypothetical protein